MLATLILLARSETADERAIWNDVYPSDTYALVDSPQRLDQATTNYFVFKVLYENFNNGCIQLSRISAGNLKLLVYYSTFKNNKKTGSGGAINVGGSIDCTLKYVCASKSYAKYFGMFLFCESNTANLKFFDTTISQCFGGKGSLYLGKGTFTIKKINISYVENCEESGALQIQQPKMFSFNNSYVYKTTAKGNGCISISQNDGSENIPDFTYSIFESNTCPKPKLNRNDEGVIKVSGASAKFSNCLFKNNGGLKLFHNGGGGVITVSSCELVDNTAITNSQPDIKIQDEAPFNNNLALSQCADAPIDETLIVEINSKELLQKMIIYGLLLKL